MPSPLEGRESMPGTSEEEPGGPVNLVRQARRSAVGVRGGHVPCDPVYRCQDFRENFVKNI